MRRKKGQIWIETVIYTLIGLSLIALVLAIVTPKVNEFRDRTVVEQTIDSLNIFDSKINEVLSAPGNKRNIEFSMKEGDLYFNTVDDTISYTFENSRSLFSEPGVTITIGRINVTTTKKTKNYDVSLLLAYSHNITFNGEDNVDTIKFSAASVPYIFSVENKGFQDIGLVNIDIREVS